VGRDGVASQLRPPTRLRVQSAARRDASRCMTRVGVSLRERLVRCTSAVLGRSRSTRLSLSLSLSPSLPPVFLSRPLSLTRDRYSANDRERGPAPAAGGKPTPFIVVVPDDSLYRRADLAQTRETERRMRPNATRAATVP